MYCIIIWGDNYSKRKFKQERTNYLMGTTSGIYYLKIYSNEVLKTEKIVVQ
jgi:Ser/Thr protein kinase RdoA (MazF antagonist)